MKLHIGAQLFDPTAARGDGGGVAGGATPPPQEEPVAERRPDGSVRVRVGEVARTAFVAGDQVWIDGRVRRVRPAVSGGAAVLPDKVTPPMPATVVKVLVNVGDAVEQGQKLVTVAAMKMETALRAPRAGTVTAVNAAPGQQVRPGDELVVIG
ncbi:MAG: biotin/lipoyl-containing protein [Myxococcota bacterium]